MTDHGGGGERVGIATIGAIAGLGGGAAGSGGQDEGDGDGSVRETDSENGLEDEMCKTDLQESG